VFIGEVAVIWTYHFKSIDLVLDLWEVPHADVGGLGLSDVSVVGILINQSLNKQQGENK
jgi:hypothetical protein